MMRKNHKGFTLFEVLIALAIVAIALAAAMRASSAASDNAFYLRQKMLAGLVAQNRMSILTASQAWPDFGSINGNETQAGVTLQWREEIISTPNPLFKKIVIHVFAADSIDHDLGQMTGYLLRPQP